LGRDLWEEEPSDWRLDRKGDTTRVLTPRTRTHAGECPSCDRDSKVNQGGGGRVWKKGKKKLVTADFCFDADVRKESTIGADVGFTRRRGKWKQNWELH